MRTTRRLPRHRSGFTLLELIIAVSLLAILAGVAVPVASRAFLSKAREATRDDLENLAAASAEYFRDSGTLPGAPLDLMIDPGVTGWSGPYVLLDEIDPLSGLSITAVDAWSNPIAFAASGDSLLTLTSPGEDGVPGTTADLSVSVDVTPVRRERTLELLDVVNQAIRLYNDQYLATDPLPASYPSILSRLAVTGFLPDTASFAVDGWGDPLQPVPSGLVPVVMVGSIHLGP